MSVLLSIRSQVRVLSESPLISRYLGHLNVRTAFVRACYGVSLYARSCPSIRSQFGVDPSVRGAR